MVKSRFILGPLTCWKAVRLFRGIGLSMNIVNILQDLYYNVILGYSLYYLVLSCNSVLPWEKCDPAWKSPSTKSFVHYSFESYNFTHKYERSMNLN